MVVKMKMKGIIYDLDGTIISSEKLHESGWTYAGQKFDISITKEMLFNQKGMPDEAASLMMLPNNKKYLLEEFKSAKQKYVIENINQITIFPSAIETIDWLIKKGYKVWICTSAYRNFVEKALNVLDGLKNIKDNIVWREMYKQKKPAPDALNLTIKKMNLTNLQVCYIGDALIDYKTTVNAKIEFIYFCPNLKESDLRIPESIPVISFHREIKENI
jgi:beta-phosphoglucomutase-like phosphatase (HAD superfamily)